MNNPLALWYYYRITDEKIEERIAYKDSEIEIIENAYQARRNEVLLDRFRLDLAALIQYDLSDPSIRYSICRQERSLREERFFSPLTAITNSSHASAQAGCPFLNAWMKTGAGKRAMLDFSTAVQACVDGIRQEALLTNEKNDEVNQMIEKLLALKKSTRREVARHAVYLYTRETFLYRVLNTALRDGDHSKVPTLGPLCFLIRNFGNAGDEYIGTVYLGVHFVPEVIASYKQSVNLWRT